MRILPIITLAGIALSSLSTLPLHGQETKIDPSLTPTVKPEKQIPLDIKKIDEHLYALGEIRINQKTREISFPAIAEVAAEKSRKTQQVVEYILVNPNGKIHESLFLTEVKPSHLNVAFKLIGYKESKELFRNRDIHLRPSEGYQTATEEEKRKSRFNLNVKWNDGEKLQNIPIHKMIVKDDGKSIAPMPAGPWVYGGSFFLEGKFVADSNKDLFAIFTDHTALGNYAGEGREDDTFWWPHDTNMPVHGTKVTISITPAFDKDTKNAK